MKRRDCGKEEERPWGQTVWALAITLSSILCKVEAKGRLCVEEGEISLGCEQDLCGCHEGK